MEGSERREEQSRNAKETEEDIGLELFDDVLLHQHVDFDDLAFGLDLVRFEVVRAEFPLSFLKIRLLKRSKLLKRFQNPEKYIS